MGKANATQDPYLIKVEFEYCDNGGNHWKKTVDLTKCGGLWWDKPNWTPGPGQSVPGDKERLGRCDPPPPAGKGWCWWNGSEWICPGG
jgi:hypothetical protein